MDRLKELLAKKAKGATLSDEETKELEKLEAEAKESETEDEEVEISESVMKELKETISVAAKEAAKEVAETVIKEVLEKNENVIRKDIGGGDKSVVTFGAGADEKEIEGMGKEMRFIKALNAMKSGDRETLKKFNLHAIAANQKAGYQNETTNADGGYLVPPADFIADVLRLEEQYGVAARDARVYDVNGNTVLMNKKASGVTMYETGEAIAKTGTKMTFGQDSVTLRKFAGIAIVTDELNDDAAVNIYNELTTDFAREAARIEDVLVFTDPSTGIAYKSGIYVQPVGAAITSLTFDHISQAIHKVPTMSLNGGKFYFHRTILGLIQRIKDTTNNYIWSPGVNGSVSGTIWGYPYELVEVMNDINVVADGNEPFIIFGNLQYSTLIRKRGLQLTTLNEGTVNASGGAAVNLAEQDATGLRAVIRRNNVVRFPTAFVAIGTGTVS